MQPQHLNVAEIISQHVLSSMAQVSEVDFSDLMHKLLRASRIFVHGSGRSGLVGKMFAMRLMHLGKQSYVVGMETTPAIESGDLLLIISGSGKTGAARQFAEKAARLNVMTVSVCLPYDHECGLHVHNKSDQCLVLNPYGKNSQFSVEKSTVMPLGSGFELSSLFLLESVISALMEKEGVDEEDLRLLHANLE